MLLFPAAMALRNVGPSAVVGFCALFATVCPVGACATVYTPTTARPAIHAGVEAQITSIRTPNAHALIAIHAEKPAWIGTATLASIDQTPCASSIQRLTVNRGTHPTDGRGLPIDGDAELKVELPGNRVSARPALFVDLSVRTIDSAGCLRLPLTAVSDERLWTATPSAWEAGMDLRLDYPTGALGGVGTMWTAVMRATRTLGPIRAFGGFTFGWAACRGDCPPLFPTSDSRENTLGEFFVHLGGEVGIERRIAMGRWTLDVGGGARTSLFHLDAFRDVPGDRNTFVLGPFASLRLGGPGKLVKGFASVDRFSNGPELILARPTALGRGSTDTAWVVSLGWNWNFGGPI